MLTNTHFSTFRQLQGTISRSESRDSFRNTILLDRRSERSSDPKKSGPTRSNFGLDTDVELRLWSVGIFHSPFGSWDTRIRSYFPLHPEQAVWCDDRNRSVFSRPEGQPLVASKPGWPLSSWTKTSSTSEWKDVRPKCRAACRQANSPTGPSPHHGEIAWSSHFSSVLSRWPPHPTILEETRNSSQPDCPARRWATSRHLTCESVRLPSPSIAVPMDRKCQCPTDRRSIDRSWPNHVPIDR